MREDKATATVIKLNRETKQGNIKWTGHDEDVILPGSDKLVGRVYKTEVKDQNLRLYKVLTKYFFDEDSWDFLEEFRLELTDDGDVALWEFPKDATVRDLYETVRFKTADAEKFFNNFLGE